MNLRIKEISNLVKGNSAIDIGADHGYLLIELSKKGFDKLLAVEKNKGPLENCLKTLKKNDLENSINTILSDGLKQVKDYKDYENIIIAGMGGDLIASIINQDIEKFKNSYLILQPNNNEYKLRKFLVSEGYEIKKEVIMEENNKIYEIIVANYEPKTKHNYSTEDLFFGIDKTRNKELLLKKWNDEYKYLNELLTNLKDKNIDKSKLEKKLKIIKKWRENEIISDNK